ncbi:sialidase-like [Hyalella azteca]|uniref:Sialidase-like n=1 Tax=Hyalella azteca TaxID=294128 RepID=A0A8B7N1J6_HYAAZ|nr:sialidase-like [Hyalella azteca]
MALITRPPRPSHVPHHPPTSPLTWPSSPAPTSPLTWPSSPAHLAPCFALTECCPSLPSSISSSAVPYSRASKRARSDDEVGATDEGVTKSSPTDHQAVQSSRACHSPLVSPSSIPSHAQESSDAQSLAMLPALSSSGSPLPPPPPLNSTSPHTNLASPPSAATPPSHPCSSSSSLEAHSSIRDLTNSTRKDPPRDHRTFETVDSSAGSFQVKVDRSSPNIADSSQNQSSNALDTLMRLFPGRRVPVLEAVLLHSGGDVLRAIQTLLYSSGTTESSDTGYKNGNETAADNLNINSRLNQRVVADSRNVTRSSPSHLPPPPPTIQRSPEPHRPYDFFQDPNNMLRSPAFSPLSTSSLGRFPYSHHAFLGLPYSPFLHPRPEYYPPLNLSAHQPIPPPLSPTSVHSSYPLLHHTSTSPLPNDQSLSPSSTHEQDSD